MNETTTLRREVCPACYGCGAATWFRDPKTNVPVPTGDIVCRSCNGTGQVLKPIAREELTDE